MFLTYTESDDDIKFICFALNKEFKFIKGSTLMLEIDNEKFETLDSIIAKLYHMNDEKFTSSSIKEFKRYRISPSAIFPEKPTILLMLNYINLVKQMLMTGTLKNKDNIDKMAKIINVDFDHDFHLLEIKAGRIATIESAAGMDNLFVETVVTDRESHICSGLRKNYKAEDLLNNTYLFLLNIKKVKLGTEESEGMICCGAFEESVEAIKIDAKENSKIKLENGLEIFQDIKYEKIDIKKAKYTEALKCFRIVDHYLTFKGKRVLCDGKLVKLNLAEGEVR